jgi:hypothetical protein
MLLIALQFLFVNAIICSIKSFAFTENAESSWVFSPVFIPEINLNCKITNNPGNEKKYKM